MHIDTSGTVVEWLELFTLVRKVAGSNPTRDKTVKLTVHPAANEYLTIIGTC